MLSRYALKAIFFVAFATTLSPAWAHSKHHSAGNGAASTTNGSLMAWLRKYYAYQDTGYAALDATRLMSRTTADYAFQDMTGKAYNRAQVIDLYTGYLSTFAEKGITVTVRTTIKHIKLSGNTATVDIVQKGHASADVSQDNSDIAQVFANGSGYDQRDTWVHLAGGWYLMASVNTSTSTDVTVGARAY